MSVQTKSQPIDITRVFELQQTMFDGMTVLHSALTEISNLPSSEGVEMKIIAQSALNEVEKQLVGGKKNA
ncbi:MAG: hypothetical protein K1X72_04400 [Pyrinomonadaceae bacterium]|nr:hypothetical protein [Pyrinomonadaceae bacterium]